MSFIALIAGARPNFMKIAPLAREMERTSLPFRIVHTGQHYDTNMSQVFFDELEIRKPDVNLEAGSGSHSQQTAKIMLAYEEWALQNSPSATLVVGDVNSTVACSLVSAKLGLPVIHLEAGLRSFDWGMPEEINRVVTDRLSQFLLTPSPDADENLRNEGVPEKRIHRVGNIMIDTLRHFLPRAKQSDILQELGVEPSGYILTTFHRPSNVDTSSDLSRIVDSLKYCAEKLPVVLPLHPRTKSKLEQFEFLSELSEHPAIHLVPPQGYLDFLALSSQAKVVATDSGGLQEETTALGIPCLTLRPNTERPVTVTEGTNTVVGEDPAAFRSAFDQALKQDGSAGRKPEFWDGKTAERCIPILKPLV